MNLFTPAELGPIGLKSRIVMAPMTRCRAPGNLANELMAEYYGQRSGAGLIITEGTSPSPNGLGYARIPAIHSPEQTASWRLVTDAVHTRGGTIFVQVMHCGRVGSVLNLPPGAELVAPSVVALSGMMWTDSRGEQPHDLPRVTIDPNTCCNHAQVEDNAKGIVARPCLAGWRLVIGITAAGMPSSANRDTQRSFAPVSSFTGWGCLRRPAPT